MHGRLKKEDIVHGMVASGGCTIVVRVRLRVCGSHLIRAAHRCLGRRCFHRAVRLRLSKRQCVRGFQEIAEAGPARRKSTRSITHEGYRPRHVKGCPDRDSITEMLGENAGIVCEVVGEIPVWPASTIFERLRKIPVIHRAPRPDAGLKQGIDEAAVVIQPFHVWGAGPGGLNAWPRDRKALALLIESLGHCDVLRIEVVLIAGNVACHPTSYFPGCMSESVPYRFAFAILIPRAFYLVGGRCGAPEKSLGKTRLPNGRGRDRTRHRTLRRWSSGQRIAGEKCSSSGCYRVHNKLTAIHIGPFVTRRQATLDAGSGQTCVFIRGKGTRKALLGLAV